MNKKKNKLFIYLLVILILAIISIIGIILYTNRPIFTNTTEDGQNTNKSDQFTTEELKACWDKFNSLLIGNWKLESDEEELSQDIYLQILGNKSFISNAWGGNGTDTTGQWDYAKGKLILDFNNDNSYWNKIDETQFKASFGSKITFDKKTSTLTIPIGYVERAEDFTGECAPDRFYIDMMNYRLYK